jgi:hypothetical protein
MAKQDATKPRVPRARTKRTSPAPAVASGSADKLRDFLLSKPSDQTQRAIDDERRQLMRAHAVVKTLSAALMNIEDDSAMIYVDTANVAADLIDDAVGRLDAIGVREPEVEYTMSIGSAVRH